MPEPLDHAAVMADPRSFEVTVTRTTHVTVQVTATTEEDARQKAERAADPLLKTMPSTFDAVINASWPAHQQATGDIEIIQGLEVLRGWWIVTSLDFQARAYTPNEFFTEDVDFQDKKTMSKRARELLNSHDPGNQTVFGVYRYHGYGARKPGEPFWTYDVKKENAMKAVRRRLNKAQEEERQRMAALKRTVGLAQTEADMVRAILEMTNSPGYGLTRCAKGRWTTHAALGDRDPATTVLDGEWSVDVDVVRHLLDRGLATVFDKFAVSGQPRQITLSPAGVAYKPKVRYG
ncbi:hypothetical protein BAJUN_01040 [Bajunvirus bajun]|uniref:Uncharacterized protein n=1 Tax=Brevundimonas phage vB_BgoS-Bajun TaxID=2948594 RepID=A0A9E7SRY5_9CAUD|nr:hypothetical protein BAJUN_01040 [Brevundimonas phage vB_BgoS-Bajun]